MKYLMISFYVLILTSCSSPRVEDYTATKPLFKLEQFFNGKLSAYGMVLDYNGKVSRRFTVKINASWQDGKGIIDEQFEYDDGELSQRIWQIEHLQDGTYSGTASDVVGTARGQSAGAAFYWRYQLRIEMDNGPIDVTLDDWMYLVDEKHLLNKSAIIKYGVKVGEVVLSIEQDE